MAGGGTAFAASLAVTSSKLTVWHQTAGCAAGTVTLFADDDSYIDQLAATSNFGGATDLRVAP